MTISKTGVCNKALHFIGIGEEIASIDERSSDAKACKMFYADALDEVLREWPWPFATRTVSLDMVNTLGDDDEPERYSTEFFYAYRYPSDCLYVRRIVSGTVPDTEESLVRYEIGSDTSGRLILTDAAEAEIKYTARISDESLFPPDFAMALAYRIAIYIAPRLVEDPRKMVDVCQRSYLLSIEKARGVAAMEESPGRPPKSSFERSR